MALGDPVGAEPLARRSVALDPTAIRSRYLLGLSRATQNKVDGETQDLLEQSALVIPQARLSLARIYAFKGDRESARAELEKYLALKPKPGQEGRRTQVEAFLKSLR